jgi:hypothetical protein
VYFDSTLSVLNIDSLLRILAKRVELRFLILPGTSSDVIQKLGGTAVQRLSDLHDVFEADVSLATLHTTHKSSVNTSFVRKGLLRDSSG